MTPRESDPGPDIEFTSTVEADEVRFREAPRTEVVFNGEPGRSSAERSRRVNLPEPVEPGVAYRDVRVEYRFEVGIDFPEESDRVSGRVRPTSGRCQDRPR